MMNDLIYSIENIFDNIRPTGYLYKNQFYYNIPEYQRGYKWKPESVNELLNDIGNFEQGNNKFYCLQNITIVPQKNCYNIVDGQQRLTTLVVLLSFLKRSDIVKDKLKYSVRPETDEFIKQFILSQSIWINVINIGNDMQTNWNNFTVENSKFDKQDIYYLFAAAYSIQFWFKDKDKNNFKVQFLDILLNHVKLIINNISCQSNEEKIFENLNSNRVPLDGADLVRAIIITRVAAEEELRTQGNLKNIVRLNEKRVRIGWELDEISNFWSNKDVQFYFSKFTDITSEKDKLPTFNKKKHPVNNLLYLYAAIRLEEARLNDSTAQKQKIYNYISLSLFENGLDRNQKAGDDTLEMYQEIYRLHRTMQDWYNDRKIYHLLGFLFFQTKIKYFEIWTEWNKPEITRLLFIDYLKSKIKELVFEDDTNDNFEKITAKKTDWYNIEQNELIKILILLDTIECTNNSQRSNLPPKYFDKYEEDREHIFPQTPQNLDEKEERDANSLRKDYLQYLLNFTNISTDNKATIEKELLPVFNKSAIPQEEISKIDEFIKSVVNTTNINSIGNLVLLQQSINRSYGNAPFAQKKAAIINAFNENIFIRPHTLKVFSRYFLTKDSSENLKNDDTVYWSETDIINNAKNIEQIIKDFFAKK